MISYNRVWVSFALKQQMQRTRHKCLGGGKCFAVELKELCPLTFRAKSSELPWYFFILVFWWPRLHVGTFVCLSTDLALYMHSDCPSNPFRHSKHRINIACSRLGICSFPIASLKIWEKWRLWIVSNLPKVSLTVRTLWCHSLTNTKQTFEGYENLVWNWMICLNFCLLGATKSRCLPTELKEGPFFNMEKVLLHWHYNWTVPQAEVLQENSILIHVIKCIMNE